MDRFSLDQGSTIKLLSTANRAFLIITLTTSALLGCSNYESSTNIEPPTNTPEESFCASLTPDESAAYAFGRDTRNGDRFTGGYSRHGVTESGGHHVLNFLSWSNDGYALAQFHLEIPIAEQAKPGQLVNQTWEFEGQDRFRLSETSEPFDLSTTIIKTTERAIQSESKVVFESIEQVPEQPYGRTCGKIVGKLEQDGEEFEFLFKMNPDFFCSDNQGGLDSNLSREFCSQIAPSK